MYTLKMETELKQITLQFTNLDAISIEKEVSEKLMTQTTNCEVVFDVKNSFI